MARDFTPKPPAKDLFGDPWQPPKDPRGRKTHKPSAQGRELVAQLKGGGASDEEIALQVGLSVPTLRKYYLRELEHGASLARNEMLRVLYEQGKKGKVAAAKAYLAETAKGVAAGVMRQPRQARAPAIGKKEQRVQTAAEIGGMYAPGPPPAKAH